MSSAGTKTLADELVGRLRGEAAPAAEADGLWSLCVCGSYARGDFMDQNSDLDLLLVGRPGCPDAPAGSSVRTLVERIMDGRRLHGHNPHQFDWLAVAWDSLPRKGQTVSVPETGPSIRWLNIFLFDLVEHLDVVWGEDPRTVFPDPPGVRALAPAWFRRARRHHALHFERRTEFRIPMTAFNSLHVAQVVFGERTLDKRRLLRLYEDNVPGFPGKEFGCWMIRNRLRQRYPDHPPEVAPWQRYVEFENELAGVVEAEVGMQDSGLPA